MVGPDGGLANVYIYLRSSKAPICPKLEAGAANQVVLDNRGCIFRPHCLKLWYVKTGVGDHQFGSRGTERGVLPARRSAGQTSFCPSAATPRIDSRGNRVHQCQLRAIIIRGSRPISCRVITLMSPFGRRRHVPHRQLGRSANGSFRRGTSASATSTCPNGQRAASPRQSGPARMISATINNRAPTAGETRMTRISLPSAACLLSACLWLGCFPIGRPVVRLNTEGRDPNSISQCQADAIATCLRELFGTPDEPDDSRRSCGLRPELFKKSRRTDQRRRRRKPMGPISPALCGMPTAFRATEADRRRPS